MRFLYEYKTKENVQQRGEISAPSRSAVYTELKKQGIKPYKVDLAPGFWNWVQSLGKRTAAIALLTIGVIAVSFLWLGQKDKAAAFEDKAIAYSDKFENKTRRQVIGDTAIIEKGIRNGWADVFPDEGERFLASFAIPGVPAGQRNTTEEEISAALSRQIVPTDSDGIEARQIKSMVEGMKDELRDFMRNGGTIKQFGSCLVERQEAELGYYNRTKSELETLHKAATPTKELESLWEKRNNELRQMGIKLVPMPE